jgi:hypothetical protein
VSGSSLTAAYYGMYGDNRHPTFKWNRAHLQERLGWDFHREWMIRWIYPTNIARYWFTPYDRSDIMKGVFDDRLFGGEKARFADMTRNSRTRILLNSTTVSGENFVFSDEEFERLASRLDTYPLSHAVMASAAFPAAFNNVTLEDYAKHKDGKKAFLHVYDGGPSGNLGIRALSEMVHDYVIDGGALKRCMLVLVDAYPHPTAKDNVGQSKRDMRSFLGFFVDDNFQLAFDDLLTSQREESLYALGYPMTVNPKTKQRLPIGANPLWQVRPHGLQKDGAPNVMCYVWHITTQTLLADRDSPEDGTSCARKAELAVSLSKEEPLAKRSITGELTQEKDLGNKVRNVKTDFRLGEPHNGNSEAVQTDIYDAAKCLVDRKRAQVEKILRSWQGGQP